MNASISLQFVLKLRIPSFILLKFLGVELSYIFGSNSGWSLLASKFSVQESYELTGFGQNCVPSFNAFFLFCPTFGT